MANTNEDARGALRDYLQTRYRRERGAYHFHTYAGGDSPEYFAACDEFTGEILNALDTPLPATDVYDEVAAWLTDDPR